MPQVQALEKGNGDLRKGQSTVQKPRQTKVGRAGGSALKETAQARGLSMGCSVKTMSKHAGRLDTNGQGCRTGKWFIVSYIHFP